MLSVGGLYDTEAFFTELEKIANVKKRLLALGEKAGLLEKTHAPALRTLQKIKKTVPGPSSRAELQLQLMKMKKERGLPI